MLSVNYLIWHKGVCLSLGECHLSNILTIIDQKSALFRPSQSLLNFVPLFPCNTPDGTNGGHAMLVTQLEHFSEQNGQLRENRVLTVAGTLRLFLRGF